MAQQLRAVTTLTENLHSVPSTHLVTHNHVVQGQVQVQAHSWCTCTHAGKNSDAKNKFVFQMK